MRSFAPAILYCFHISNVFWLPTGGGPRQLFCKKFTLLHNVAIVNQNSKFWFSWRIVVVRNTRGRKTVRWVDNLDLSPREGKLAAQCCAMISCNINWDLTWEWIATLPCLASTSYYFALFRHISAGGGAWLLSCKKFEFCFAMTRMEIGWMLDFDKNQKSGWMVMFEYQYYGNKMPTFLRSADEVTSKVLGILSCWWSARWTEYQFSLMLSVQLPGSLPSTIPIRAACFQRVPWIHGIAKVNFSK